MTTLPAARSARTLASSIDRGVEDLEAGRLDRACPAIDESYKLDPRPGTLFALAECEAKRGRLAAAARRYDEYLAVFAALPADKKRKQSDREKTAREQRAALGARVAELTLVLSPGAPRGTVVTRDGEAVAEAALGVPFPVDAGEHVVTTRARGGPITRVRVTMAPGEKKGIALDVQRAGAPGGEAALEAALDADQRALAARQEAPVGEATLAAALDADQRALAAQHEAVSPLGGGVNQRVLIGGGTVGGAGVVVGGALLAIFAYKKGSDADFAQARQTGCPRHGIGATGACKTLADTLATHDALANAGLWTLVSGGLVGALTLVYGLAGGSRAPRTAVRVLPAVTGNGGGLLVGGTF